MDRFPLENVDGWRGPTASQATGLTLAAARAIVAAVQDVARGLGVVGTVGVSGGDASQDRRAGEARVATFAGR